MTLWSWALSVAALVLAAGGVLKVVEPAASRPMMEAFELPSSPVAMRCWGAIELAISVTVLAGGPWLATAALGCSYTVFTLMVALLRRRSPTTSCGCIGRWSAPPTRRHILINAAGALVGAAALVTRSSAVPPTDQLGGTVTYWVAAVVAAAAILVTLSGTTVRRR